MTQTYEEWKHEQEKKGLTLLEIADLLINMK